MKRPLWMSYRFHCLLVSAVESTASRAHIQSAGQGGIKKLKVPWLPCAQFYFGTVPLLLLADARFSGRSGCGGQLVCGTILAAPLASTFPSCANQKCLQIPRDIPG